MKEEVINIKVKVSLDQFIAIENYLAGNGSKEDCDLLASLLKNVHDKVYRKASILETIGNRFVDK